MFSLLQRFWNVVFGTVECPQCGAVFAADTVAELRRASDHINRCRG